METIKLVSGGKVTLSVPEVADLLGISKSAAYDCVRSGELPSIKMGRRILIPVTALQAIIDQAAA